MKRGIFITFEGPDGSGKSTQIEKLTAFLKAQGESVTVTREPGGTAIGEQIRSLILDPKNTGMSDTAEMMLYAAARAQIVDELILPDIKAGKIVICDRFVDSSIAYQGYGRELRDAVERVNAFAVKECIPDLTILLDIAPERCFARKKDDMSDRIESEALAWHERVYRGYLDIAAAHEDRIKIVDADRDKDLIQQDVQALAAGVIRRKRQEADL
ncbi:MAG: dTMP kinase [Clostridiales Family XIII bacterium]|jgi:dTMP kinase|nr:dTMP kinase [Clostridiales Family XIII bacterium]